MITCERSVDASSKPSRKRFERNRLGIFRLGPGAGRHAALDMVMVGLEAFILAKCDQEV